MDIRGPLRFHLQSAPPQSRLYPALLSQDPWELVEIGCACQPIPTFEARPIVSASDQWDRFGWDMCPSDSGSRSAPRESGQMGYVPVALFLENRVNSRCKWKYDDKTRCRVQLKLCGFPALFDTPYLSTSNSKICKFARGCRGLFPAINMCVANDTWWGRCIRPGPIHELKPSSELRRMKL
jgi:hypothetical protein